MKTLEMKYLNLFALILSLFTGLVLSSCDKECNESNSLKDPVYFQYEARNYAWGFYHVGWYIDNKGNFDYYSLPEDLVEPDSSGYISKANLLANLTKADSIVYNISIHALQNQVELIDAVDEKKFSEIEHVGADIGIVNLYCYQWDKNRNLYKRFLLATGGDFIQYNLDPEARELTAWMIAIGDESGTFSWH
ncbi:MAG: hypothetical protein IPP15_05585 [Saprospiraceae bacterium]|uniref:Uncharacterized protein n=1 Tax=Candidatus Opimibacter skivensis TaxID=2982028 RepID=A0A9D7SRD9_9BACT|nr:hypothetical protein [Candidatus Opimibacter skivensis]